jgi:hypothetical protein
VILVKYGFKVRLLTYAQEPHLFSGRITLPILHCLAARRADDFLAADPGLEYRTKP